MKFNAEDEFVTAVVRLPVKDAERLRQYPDDALLLVEGSYVVPIEVVRVGSLPDPAELSVALITERPACVCPETACYPHTHVPFTHPVRN